MLGPTNTGKTHAAIEAMLACPTGMIGLPLRLLAREVYDRLTARLGEQAVALCTGEERRIPPRARYWACTVEAMPTSSPFAFVGVDEVQLAADPARGHIFTDRILHARGTETTWLCGSATMEPLLRRLLPGLDVRGRPRLSTLRHVGHRPLKTLPPRSAVVAFSAGRVVELAEKVRRKHGGAAVVFGALSPRTRNAQVAMFESGEVHHLVATDAIGMGLNLSLDGVALAELDKFDGRARRRLRSDELAQIAGRAGRFQCDGEFGTTEGAPALPPEVAAAVENSQLPDLRHLQWRPSALDFHSVSALRASLTARPPHPALRRVELAEDEATLAALLELDSVLRLTRSAPAVELLWEVSRVPDFRQVGALAHAAQLAEIYAQLVERGRLSRRAVEARILQLERIDGEVEDLLDRVAAIRTWTYLCGRRGWVDDGAALAEMALGVETLLSDALHARLAERFVDRAVRVGSSTPLRLDADGAVRVGNTTIGAVRGLTWEGADPAPALLRALEPDVQARVERLVEGKGGFAIDAELRVSWEGGPLARLTPGPHPTEPGIRLLRNPVLPAGAALRVARRTQAWLRDWLAELFAPLRDEEAPPAARGLLYALQQGLGSVRAHALVPGELGAADRRALARAGVRFGVHHVWSELMAERTEGRATLYAVAAALSQRPPLPSAPIFRRGDAHPAYLLSVGWAPAGPLALRFDEFERIAAGLRALARRGAFTAEEAEALGLPGWALEDALADLGYARAGGTWRRAKRR
jgi:ATP-dependent RNA helicase SUPV3L1/SUV3